MNARWVWEAFHSPPSWCTITFHIVIFLCIPDLSIKISCDLINWLHFHSKSQWLILHTAFKCFVNASISWCNKDINRHLGLRITVTESLFLDIVRYVFVGICFFPLFWIEKNIQLHLKFGTKRIVQIVSKHTNNIMKILSQ